MTEGHTNQSIVEGVAIKCWAINNLLSDRLLPHTVDGLMVVENPARTGLWTVDGQFDEEVFSDLSTRAIEIKSGQKVVTREIMMAFLKEKHKPKTLGTATYLAYVVPVSWEAVTEGSIKELYYSDRSFIDHQTGETVKAMTLVQTYVLTLRSHLFAHRKNSNAFIRIS
jgi:hypothetical protein